MSFSKTLEHLLDKVSLRRSMLFGLSKLETDEIEHLTSVWPSIPVARRRALVQELIEISEANFEVDFDPIFRWGLLDSDPQVRSGSVEGLWENEELALMTDLLEMVQNDPAVPVRAAAALSLGRFILLGELGKLPFDRCQPVYDTLCALFRTETEDIDIRRRALESVAYVSDETVVDLLQEAYDHPEEKMRISAVFGMGRSADERWIGTVMGELFSVSPEMRYEAARACGELEAREAVPRLAELIDDPDREVQEAALWALGQTGGDEAKQLLQTYAEEEDEFIRSAAEAALEELYFMYGQLDLPFYELDALDSAEPDPSS